MQTVENINRWMLNLKFVPQGFPTRKKKKKPQGFILSVEKIYWFMAYV